MKLFFAVLFAMLAVGFISWLTLSMAKVVQHHHNAPVQSTSGTTNQPSN